jgi:class 3 adenylate cyclase/ribosomal protein L40E
VIAPVAEQVCASCGAKNPSCARFCMECGSGLPRTCAACGADAPSRAKFCMACGSSFDALTEKTRVSAQRAASSDRPSVLTPKHIAERVLRDRDAMQGERKAVTVLFADIKGSTSLIQHEDPEEAGLILQTVLRSMIEAVHRFDGVVSKVMGDGLMALFGAPLALEDHAVRGSYAALAMPAESRCRSELA